MTSQLQIRTIQANPSVGDLFGNYNYALHALHSAAADGIDIVLFSELFITGYPPKDWLLQKHFVQNAELMVEKLARECAELDVAFVMGLPYLERSGRYNGAWFIHQGEILQKYAKTELPNYGVFDEKRVFDPAPYVGGVVRFKGHRIGVGICEDIWHAKVPDMFAQYGVDLVLSPNASPYARGKPEIRKQVIWQAAKRAKAPIIYCNPYGSQDELQFDGRSCAMNPTRQYRHSMAALAKDWARDVLDVTLHQGRIVRSQERPDYVSSEVQDDYLGAVQGLRDYVQKTYQQQVILGSSGGIDSAMVATIAVDALGAENVNTLMLPSPYSSDGSLVDAIQLAKNLGIKKNYAVHISDAYHGMRAQLIDLMAKEWQLPFEGVGDENLQPRLRMNYLNAIANELTEQGMPCMALTTGNKSELSIGFYTAGGDGFGFYNPIKDLYKMRVYELARWRNTPEAHALFGTDGERIPQAIIDKEPTAELKENQKDTDSLPPYPVLDYVLEQVMEIGSDPVTLALSDAPPCFGDINWFKTVEWVYKRLIKTEFKRQVGPLGPILSRYAFDLDRRYPIVSSYNPFDYMDDRLRLAHSQARCQN